MGSFWPQLYFARDHLSGTILYPTHPVVKAFKSMCARGFVDFWVCVCVCVCCVRASQCFNSSNALTNKWNLLNWCGLTHFMYCMMHESSQWKRIWQIGIELVWQTKRAVFRLMRWRKAAKIINEIVSRPISKFFQPNVRDFYLIKAKRVLSLWMCHHSTAHHQAITWVALCQHTERNLQNIFFCFFFSRLFFQLMVFARISTSEFRQYVRCSFSGVCDLSRTAPLWNQSNYFFS